MEKQYNKISTKRLVIGILIGVFVAFSIYSILYIFRESFRYLSITDDFDLWVLSDDAVNFYNIIFGFIAVIFGQSSFFSFAFNLPRSCFEQKHYLNIAVLNDQRFLNLSFAYWFLNISFIAILYFGLTFQGGFYILNFYPKYNYVFILLVIVLFLQTWTTIRRGFKQKSIKCFLGSVFILSLFAFGLSRINLIDYKSINEICLQKNIIDSYQINLPESSWTEDEWKSASEQKRIYIATKNEETIFITDNKQIKLDDLLDVALEWKRELIKTEFVSCKLYISQEQKMSVVNELKAELAKCGIQRIAYAVIPTQIEYDKRFYRDKEIRLRLPYFAEKEFINYYENTQSVGNILKIRNNEEGVFLNEKLFSSNEIKFQIKKSIIENPDYVFEYKVLDNNVFSEYIKVYSLLKGAIEELRDEYVFNKYGKSFDLFDEKIARDANQKYPFRLVEITEKLAKLIN